jgi:hypothetical protein
LKDQSQLFLELMSKSRETAWNLKILGVKITKRIDMKK